MLAAARTRLRRALAPHVKRIGAPIWRALQWRIERVFDERLGGRLEELDRRTAAPLNQIASTNAVLREAARRHVELSRQIAELEGRVRSLEAAVAGAPAQPVELPPRVALGLGSRSRTA